MNDPSSPEAVWVALRAILDPEFGINLVDLGLIYDVTCDLTKIHVTMTLTTESCPAGSWIYEGVGRALSALPGARAVQVDLVFEPRWSTACLSEKAREQLGLSSD